MKRPIRRGQCPAKAWTQGHVSLCMGVFLYCRDGQQEVVIAQKAINHLKQDPAYYCSFTAPKCWMKDSVAQNVTDSVTKEVCALESHLDVYLSVDFCEWYAFIHHLHSRRL